jgi:hypothetical protein
MQHHIYYYNVYSNTLELSWILHYLVKNSEFRTLYLNINHCVTFTQYNFYWYDIYYYFYIQVLTIVLYVHEITFIIILYITILEF